MSDAVPGTTQTPHHDVPRDARPFQGQPAGIVTRGLAAVLDGLLVIGIAGGIWVGWSAIRFIIRPSHFTFPSPTVWFASLVCCLVAWIYLTVGWATSGRTLGSQLLGLRVVTGGGGRVGLSVSAVRALTYIVFPAGLLWVAVSNTSRSVQDLVLRTHVVYDWSRQPTPSATDHPVDG